MSLENDLRKETRKWTKKIEKEMKSVRLSDPDDPAKKRLLENMNAYVKDSKHFLAKGDLIRSFEAIIWGWAWLEILKELEILK